MAIQSRTINGSFTEIYVGGGNFITQAFPTNFHKFWTKKILTSSENIEDFKEVTSAEKTTIEAADAKWEEPSEEFIAECKAMGVVYNDATGYFELNGLVDITTEQMRQILPYLTLGKMRGDLPGRFQRVSVRTITIYCEGTNFPVNMAMAFYVASRLETIKFTPMSNNMVGVKDMDSVFRYCSALQRVDGVINVSEAGNTITYSFVGCVKLQEIRIHGIKNPVIFKDSPFLSVESVKYLVDNSANTAPITVTLHPDAYARLTDEIITAATAKQINFATETA